MPAFQGYAEIMEQLVLDVRDAWGPTKIFKGRPIREILKSEKVAVIELIGFDQTAEANGFYRQLPRFMITLVNEVPESSVNILDTIVAETDSLITKLEQTIRYAGVMMQPTAGITVRSEDDQISAAKGTYQASVDFVGMVSASYSPS